MDWFEPLWGVLRRVLIAASLTAVVAVQWLETWNYPPLVYSTWSDLGRTYRESGLPGDFLTAISSLLGAFVVIFLTYGRSDWLDRLLDPIRRVILLPFALVDRLLPAVPAPSPRPAAAQRTVEAVTEATPYRETGPAAGPEHAEEPLRQAAPAPVAVAAAPAVTVSAQAPPPAVSEAQAEAEFLALSRGRRINEPYPEAVQAVATPLISLGEIIQSFWESRGGLPEGQDGIGLARLQTVVREEWLVMPTAFRRALVRSLRTLSEACDQARQACGDEAWHVGFGQRAALSKWPELPPDPVIVLVDPAVRQKLVTTVEEAETMRRDYEELRKEFNRLLSDLRDEVSREAVDIRQTVTSVADRLQDRIGAAAMSPAPNRQGAAAAHTAPAGPPPLADLAARIAGAQLVHGPGPLVDTDLEGAPAPLPAPAAAIAAVSTAFDHARGKWVLLRDIGCVDGYLLRQDILALSGSVMISISITDLRGGTWALDPESRGTALIDSDGHRLPNPFRPLATVARSWDIEIGETALLWAGIAVLVNGEIDAEARLDLAPVDNLARDDDRRRVALIATTGPEDPAEIPELEPFEAVLERVLALCGDGMLES